MSRADARINVILDAMVDTLRAIDGDPASWLTHPKKVLRWSPNPLEEPRPCLIVRCVRWGPNEPQTGLQHDAEATIEVEVFTEFGAKTDDPDRELHRVCSDVIGAVAADWQLRDSGVTNLRVAVIDGYEPAQANVQTAGLAQTTIGFKAFWQWEASTP